MSEKLNGNNPFITPETFINISGMFGNEKVIHTIFNENPEIDKITKNTGKTDFEKLPYSKNQIEGYFRYRLNDGKADHGIISGYIFYDALVKNYLENLKKHLKENPLLFFLCLADTLEPTKFFYQFDAQKVLDGIEIEAGETKLTLSINDDFAANCETVEKWFEKIESMKKWMKINVKRGADGKSIEILLGKKAGMKKRKALNLV